MCIAMSLASWERLTELFRKQAQISKVSFYQQMKNGRRFFQQLSGRLTRPQWVNGCVWKFNNKIYFWRNLFLRNDEFDAYLTFNI